MAMNIPIGKILDINVNVEQPIFKTNKSYCIQLSKWEGFRTGFNIVKSDCQAHAGVDLSILFLGFELYMSLYDNRHWN